MLQQKQPSSLLSEIDTKTGEKKDGKHETILLSRNVLRTFLQTHNYIRREVNI